MSECWLMSEDIADPHAPNKRIPNVPVNTEALAALGIRYRRLNPSDLFSSAEKLDARLETLQRQLGFAAHDTVSISPAKHPEGPAAFTQLLELFFTEHIHDDDEARVILHGAGYFDVRDANYAWLRIYVTAGDFLSLPAGIAHRFTLDHTQYAEALRLFTEHPKWIAIPPPFEDNTARRRYVQFLRGPRSTILNEENGSPWAKVLVEPYLLDGYLDSLLLPQHEEKEKDEEETQQVMPDRATVKCVVLFFTGRALPTTAWKSWCEDCVAAEEKVREGVRLLQSTRKETVFLQCDVEQFSYNDTHPYCTHPVLELKHLPTVLVLAVKPIDPTTRMTRTVEDSKATCDDTGSGLWKNYVELVVRTEKPTVSTLTEW